ncbi:MAG TPA: GNAT family protein [Anaerolineaceae bacterium]
MAIETYPPFPWETQRLILRPFEERDLGIFSAYRSDPEVARYQSWDAPFDMSRARAFYSWLQSVRPGMAGEWYQFAVELKATRQLIGDYVLGFAKEGSQAEFGVTFSRAAQGKGYATEGARCLFTHAFNSLGLHRIFARLDARNTRSALLMERLGMRREGYMVKSEWHKGEWTDVIYYAVLREEWQA